MTRTASLARTLLLGCLATLTGVACSPSCPTDESFLLELAALGEGETLTLPAACTITTGFVVEPGRRVEGGLVRLGPNERIELVPSSGTATELAHVAVESDAGDASIVVDGPGSTSIRDLTLTLRAGIGIVIRGGTATLSGVDVVGNVDPANVLSLPVPANPSTLATYGLVVLDRAMVTLDDAQISTTATGGILCENATLSTSQTSLDRHRGNAAAFYACTVTLDTTTVTGTLATPTLVGMGLIVAAGTSFGATSLTIGPAPGFGAFVDASRAAFDAPSVSGLGQAGIYGSTDADVTIRDGEFSDNRGAAIAAVGSRALTVLRTLVATTSEAPILRPSGAGTETMADGIHVVQLDAPLETLVVSDTMLLDNGRVGMVLDGGGLALAPSLSAVDASGTGTQLGVVAQNDAGLPVMWDGGVTRAGSPAELDVTAPLLPVSTGISLTGILMPPTITF